MLQKSDFRLLTTKPTLALWQASEESACFRTFAMIRTGTYIFFHSCKPQTMPQERRPTGMSWHPFSTSTFLTF